MRGNLSGDRESLEPGELLSDSAPDCARHDALKLWPNGRGQRGREVLHNCFGAFFRRHEKTLSERGAIRAREILAIES
jgi:hypothetical protein